MNFTKFKKSIAVILFIAIMALVSINVYARSDILTVIAGGCS